MGPRSPPTFSVDCSTIREVPWAWPPRFDASSFTRPTTSPSMHCLRGIACHHPGPLWLVMRDPNRTTNGMTRFFADAERSARESFNTPWNPILHRNLPTEPPPCELQYAEWLHTWVVDQPMRLPCGLPYDVWRRVIDWLPRPWDLRRATRAFCTVPPRCRRMRPSWSTHLPLHIVCAQHHSNPHLEASSPILESTRSYLSHRIRRCFVQVMPPTVIYSEEHGFLVLNDDKRTPTEERVP